MRIQLTIKRSSLTLSKHQDQELRALKRRKTAVTKKTKKKVITGLQNASGLVTTSYHRYFSIRDGVMVRDALNLAMYTHALHKHFTLTELQLRPFNA